MARFRGAAERIAAADEITAADERAVLGWLQLRDAGVPTHLRHRYQVNLSKAVAFLNDAEVAGLQPEMLLVAMAAYSRDDLGTMNGTTRASTLPRLVAEAQRLTSASMRRWAEQHLEM
jgi:hypothetical protein